MLIGRVFESITGKSDRDFWQFPDKGGEFIMICPICFGVNDQSFEKGCEGHQEVTIRYCRVCGEPLEYCIKCLSEDNVDAYINGFL